MKKLEDFIQCRTFDILFAHLIKQIFSPFWKRERQSVHIHVVIKIVSRNHANNADTTIMQKRSQSIHFFFEGDCTNATTVSAKDELVWMSPATMRDLTKVKL